MTTSGYLFVSSSQVPLGRKSVVCEFMMDRRDCKNLSTIVDAKRNTFAESIFVGSKGSYQRVVILKWFLS